MNDSSIKTRRQNKKRFGFFALAAISACSGTPELFSSRGKDGGGADDADVALGGKGSPRDDDIDVGASGGSGSGTDGNVAQGGLAVPPDFDFPDITFDYEPSLGGLPDSCADTFAEPVPVVRPMDIVFIIDNSGSMSNEIAAVEQNIYDNFATIIEDSDIDYRVIMISRYGSSSGPTVGDSNFGVCIPSPFGINDCSAPVTTPLPAPASQPSDRRFFHYSADIESRDALCVLLDSLDRPDEFDDQLTTDDGAVGSAYRNWVRQTETGWSAWLREEAFKTFVVITDDRVQCNTGDFDDKGTNVGIDFPNVAFDDLSTAVAGATVAEDFDEALLGLSPSQFGTTEARNYIFHSIVGLEEKDSPLEPWQPDEPIQLTKCEEDDNSESERVGTGYQALSVLTGGLRYPICSEGGTNFNPVFTKIAEGVVETAAVPCEYDVPEVDGIIDPANIRAQFTPGGGGAKETFTRVADEAACTGNTFYLDSPTSPTKLFLCDDTCDLVQADTEGKLEINFGCLGS